MTNYQEVRVKLTNIQLNKLKLAVKNKTGTTLSEIYLARDNLPGLVNRLASNAINTFERKISEKGAIIAGNSFTLFISNEDISDIIKIIKSLEDSGVLIDGITESVKLKHEIKNKEGVFFLLC